MIHIDLSHITLLEIYKDIEIRALQKLTRKDHDIEVLFLIENGEYSINTETKIHFGL